MKQRIVTATVLATVVIAVLWSANPIPIWIMAVAVSIYCGTELRDLVRCGTGFGFGLYSAALMGVVYEGTKLAGLAPVFSCLVFLSLFLLGVMGSWASGAAPSRWAFALVSPFWIVMPFAACILLSEVHAEPGLWRHSPPLLLAFLPVWGGDIAAIFVGKSFGRHRLAPEISPKKTVEGALGNLAVSMLVAGITGPLTGFGLLPSIGAGFAIGTIGQAGDLFESALKRRASLKDSGWILPGHGGALDRIDSFLFAAPFVVLILLAFR